MQLSKRYLSECLVCVMMLSLYLSFIVFAGLKVVDSPSIQMGIRILALACGVGAILIKSGNFLYVAGSFFVGLLLILFSSNYLVLNVMFLAVFVAIAGVVSMTGLSLSVLFSSLAGIFLHLYLYFVAGVSSDDVLVGDRARLAMGFANPNLLALTYFSFLASAIFFFFHKRCIFSGLVLLCALVLCVPVIYISDSRTFLISVIIFFVLIAFFKIPAGRAVGRFVAVMAPVLGALASLYLASGVDPWVDELLSGRPSFFYQYMSRGDGLNFFFGWPVVESDTVDNAYLLFIGALGYPLALVFFVWISLKLFFVPFSRLPFVLVMLMASIFESALIRPELPFALLFVAAIFLKENRPERVAVRCA